MNAIAIIGGGPSGSTIATLLQQKGMKVALFTDNQPRELYVGESMIPAIIPVLRRLGVEEEVKSFSVHKPGATVWVKDGLHAEAAFSQGLGRLPEYAYNTPRKDFDSLLFQKAVESGVKVFPFPATLRAEGDKVLLDDETLAKCEGFFDGQPDFIVDASGRRRVVSNLLKLPVTKGKRMDTALFAHVDNNEFSKNYGDIHMHLANRGWCWRIPLPGKTSVGIVVDKEYLQQYGSTPEEQFDRFIREDPKLAPFLKDVTRLSGIQKYSNYQLQSNRLYGANWALVGDAAGFLDPVFSSGLYFSMNYAAALADILDPNMPGTLADYQKRWNKELKSWKKMIELWYNGRLFTNFLMGNDRLDSKFGQFIGKHAVKHFTSVFTGEAIQDKYSMFLLRFMTGPLLDFMYVTRMHRYKYKDLEL